MTPSTPLVGREGSSAQAGAPPTRRGLLLGTAVLLAGCARGGTLLEVGTTEVELEVGQTLQVDLGLWSPGVGDDWGVVSRTAPEVADAEVVMGSDVVGVRRRRPDAGAGGDARFAVEITGRSPGTTTIRSLLCWRATIEEGCEQQPGRPIDPVEITVTVR